MNFSLFESMKPASGRQGRRNQRIRILFAETILAFGLAFNAQPASYYVDFSSGSDANNGLSTNTPWKDAPGMRGFSGTYTHQAGDQFFFRGGVTWSNTMAPWDIANSGVPGTNDYYGVDMAWFAGASWTRPVFDGGSQYPVPSTQSLGYWAVSGNYVTLDNITLQNIGVPGTNQGNYAIKLTGHDILVENMYLPVQSRAGILLSDTSGHVDGNWEFRSNDISLCSWGIGGGPGVGTVMTNILIHDNVFHDFHTQIANSAHGDGIYIYSSVTNLNTYCDGFRIYNNYFYGDFSKADTSATGMTAFIWASAQAAGSAYIYNNVMTYTWNGGGVSDVIGATGTIGSTGSVYVFNNSFYGDSNSFYFVSAGNISNVVVMNNIDVGGSSSYSLSSVLNNLVSDYNDLYHQSTFTGFNLVHSDFTNAGPIASISVRAAGSNYTVGSIVKVTYGLGGTATITSTNSTGGVTALQLTTLGIGYSTRWTGLSSLVSGTGVGLTVSYPAVIPAGYETHGTTNNPLFTAAADLHLQSGSPAIGAGTNLSFLFTTDKDGNSRPATGQWDIGAYQYIAPLEAPSNLREDQ
jgi:hypothetical protein